MAKHIVKCFFCGQMFDASKEPYEKPRNNRYAHKSCYDINLANLAKDDKDKNELYAYLRTIFNISDEDDLPPKFYLQITKYRSDYHYTYKGLYYAMRYHYEVKHGDIKKGYGLGIVPYVYDNAQEYYQKIEKAVKANQNKTIEETLSFEEIQIIPPKRKPMKPSLFKFLD